MVLQFLLMQDKSTFFLPWQKPRSLEVPILISCSFVSKLMSNFPSSDLTCRHSSRASSSISIQISPQEGTHQLSTDHTWCLWISTIGKLDFGPFSLDLPSLLGAWPARVCYSCQPFSAAFHFASFSVALQRMEVHLAVEDSKHATHLLSEVRMVRITKQEDCWRWACITYNDAYHMYVPYEISWRHIISCIKVLEGDVPGEQIRQASAARRLLRQEEGMLMKQ